GLDKGSKTKSIRFVGRKAARSARVVELKFARSQSFPTSHVHQTGHPEPPLYLSLLLRGRQRGGRASFSLRLIRLWRNRQLARNDTQIVQRIWKHHTGLSFPFSPPKKFSRRRQSQHTERYNRRRLVRFETAQLRKDLGAEQPDRTHQVFLSDVADIELAE